MTDGLMDKLRALRTMYLDERCTVGERENAKSLYHRLLTKYGLTDDDIVKIDKEEKTQTFWFHYSSEYERKLLHQIAAKVVEPKPLDSFYQSRVKKQADGFDLTESEKEQVAAKYNSLRKALKKEFKAFYRAFVQSNDLGLEPRGETPELSEEERREIEQMLKYAQFIEPTKVAITNKRRLLEQRA